MFGVDREVWSGVLRPEVLGLMLGGLVTAWILLEASTPQAYVASYFANAVYGGTLATTILLKRIRLREAAFHLWICFLAGITIWPILLGAITNLGVMAVAFITLISGILLALATGEARSRLHRTLTAILIAIGALTAFIAWPLWSLYAAAIFTSYWKPH